MLLDHAQKTALFVIGMNRIKLIFSHFIQCCLKNPKWSNLIYRS